MFLNFRNRFFHKLSLILPGGYTIRPSLHRMRGATIGKNVWISQYVYLDELHPEAIIIGDNCTIGLRTSIFTHFHWGKRKLNNYSSVVIENNVFVGPHCLILPGVKIGEGAVIKGGTVISKKVPPFTFWGPTPDGPLARVTVPLTPEHTFEEFVKGLRPIRKRKV